MSWLLNYWLLGAFLICGALNFFFQGRFRRFLLFVPFVVYVLVFNKWNFLFFLVSFYCLTSLYLKYSLSVLKDNKEVAYFIYLILILCLLLLITYSREPENWGLMGLGMFLFCCLGLVYDTVFLKLESSIGNIWRYLFFLPKFQIGPMVNYNKFNTLEVFVFDRVLLFRVFDLFLLGGFKKFVLADSLLDVAALKDFGVLSWMLLPFAFLHLLKIYLDFSGLVDIISAFSLLLGFESILNFNKPLLASSFKDYWDRWNIGLSSWLKDYVFFPVTYVLRQYLGVFAPLCSLVFVFFIIGIWHGGTISYLLFAFFHVIFLFLENFYKINWGKGHVGYFKLLYRLLFLAILSLITLFFTNSPFEDVFRLFHNYNFHHSISYAVLQDYSRHLLFGFLLFLVYFFGVNFWYRLNPLSIVMRFFLVLIIIAFWPLEPSNFVYDF